MITFDDIGQVCASFHCDTDIAPGSACSVSRALTVIPCREDEPFIGKVITCRNNVACVAVSGLTTFSYKGTTPGIGYICLCGDGTGGIEPCSEGKGYWVVSVDPTNHTATVLL